MKLLFFFLLCFSLLFSAQNIEKQKIALLIGNSDYLKPNQLKNPVKDIDLMEKVLKNSDFQVVKVANASREKMRTVIKKFKNRKTNGGVKLFYFAGHGMKVDGKNYLIPVDSLFTSKDEIPYQAISLNDILYDLKSQRDMLDIVILDACRDNPISTNKKGLAPLGDTFDTFVAYATQAGNTALDGDGSNGIYTKYLAKHIQTPNLSLEEVFKNTYRDVYEETKGAQKPVIYSQIATNFYFNQNKRALKVKKNKKVKVEHLPMRVHLRYIEPKMVKIKAGTFTMGSNSQYETQPLHKVTIKNDFFAGQYEVTFKEYDMFCKDTGYKKPNDFGWKRGAQPVVDVSYNDALAYTQWLSKKTSKKYTLPTEAQWEYMARASSSGKYFFKDERVIDSYVWYDDTAISHPYEVGLKKANQFELYDMLGNVREWVLDDYLPYENKQKIASSYNDTTNTKVIRGGSYQNAYDEVTVYQRDYDIKSFKDKQTGFRVILLP